jgi:hypothetical protein
LGFRLRLRRSELDLGGELELFAGVLVEVGGEVGAATGFVEAGGADYDEFLRLSEALGVDGALATDHADRGELGDLVGERHERGDGAERLVGEGGVEAGYQDTLAEGDKFERERDDVRGEELDLVDADDFDFGELREEFVAELFDRRDDRGVVGLRVVGRDGGAVVAEVDVGLIAGHALAGDAGALEAADQLFGLAGKHGAGDDFEDSGSGGVHGSLRLRFGLSFIVRAGAVDKRAGIWD